MDATLALTVCSLCEGSISKDTYVIVTESHNIFPCWNCGTKYEVHEEENHWGSIEHGGEVVTVIDPEDRENTVRLTGQGEGRLGYL